MTTAPSPRRPADQPHLPDMAGVEILALPAFRDNYIWLLRAKGWLIVVDPGDAKLVIRHLEDSGDTLAAILLTHHHADHVGGVEEILARGTRTNTHGQSESDDEVVCLPVFGPACEGICGINRPLSGGESIELSALAPGFPDHARMDVLAVPGHTRGHLAYYGANLLRPGEGALFCGDTLFTGGCGRLFEGSPEQMHASLTRLASLPESTLVYCAHEYTLGNLKFALSVEPGNPYLQRRYQSDSAARAEGRPTVPSRLRLELDTNPFLRCHVPAVRAAARAHDDGPPDNEAGVFAALRAWKNNF